MGHEAVVKALSDISMADGMSYAIVGSLTVIMVLVMRSMLPAKGLGLVFAPAIFWGGLCGIYALREAGIVFSADKSANVAAASAFGMIAALIVMMGLTRLVDVVTRIRKPLVNAPVRVRY
jgi:hypothetical protein